MKVNVPCIGTSVVRLKDPSEIQLLVLITWERVDILQMKAGVFTSASRTGTFLFKKKKKEDKSKKSSSKRKYWLIKVFVGGGMGAASGELHPGALQLLSSPPPPISSPHPSSFCLEKETCSKK